MGLDLRRLDPRRRSAARRARTLHKAGGFYPAQLSKVSAWLRVANGTVTGAGYSSIPDALGATSPATQSTDANRPVNGTAANGLPIMNLTDDFLFWPLSAANNGATKNGFACWCKSNNTGIQNLFVIWNGGGGASAAKADFFVNASNLNYFCETGGTAAKSGLMTANTWHFVTCEYDGTQATDAARLLVTVDGTVIGTTNTTIPASQPTPTGNAWIGGFSSAQSWVGSIGPNFFFLNAQLSAAERTALMNFEVPT